MRGSGAVNFLGDKSRGIPPGGGSTSSNTVQTFGIGGGQVLEDRISRLEEVVNANPGLLVRLQTMEQKIVQLEVISIKSQLHSAAQFDTSLYKN